MVIGIGSTISGSVFIFKALFYLSPPILFIK